MFWIDPGFAVRDKGIVEPSVELRFLGSFCAISEVMITPVMYPSIIQTS
jgi:hypothetical protein